MEEKNQSEGGRKVVTEGWEMGRGREWKREKREMKSEQGMNSVT